MKSSLKTVAEILTGGEADVEALPWHRLIYQHTQAIRSRLAEEYTPATVNKHLSALRGVLKEAWRLGMMDAEEYQRAAEVEGLKADRLPKGRRLTLGELFALKTACQNDEGPAGARDLAIIAVLARGGLRRSEAVGLELSDDRPEAGEGEEVAELVVRRGKGNKDRVVALANGAKEAVDDWMEFTRFRRQVSSSVEGASPGTTTASTNFGPDSGP